MNRIWTVLCFQLKNTMVNPFRLSWREKHGRFKTIVQPLILFVVFIPIFLMYLQGVFASTAYLYELGKAEIPLQFSLLLSQILILFFSINTLASTFYFSKDMELMLTLPIKAEEVFIAKFLRVFLGESVLNFLILFPPLLAYNMYVSVDVAFWIKSILVLLLNPMYPLAISLLLMVILMRLAGKSKRKNVFQTFNLVLGLVIGIGINVIVRTSSTYGDFDQNGMLAFLTSQEVALEKISRVFVTVKLGKLAMVKSGVAGVLPLLGIILMTGVSLFVLAYFSRVTYYQTLAENRDIGKKKKRLPKSKYKVNHPSLAIMWKDIKRTIRTPIFLYQSLSGLIFFVVFFGIQLFLQKDKFSFPVNISAYIDSYLWQIRILFGALIGLVLGVFNTSTLTLFSREGKYAWIHRVLPIQPKDELMGRVFYGWLINLPIVILAMIAYQVFVQIDLYLILFSIPGAMMMLFPQITLPLAVDAKFPHLHWEDPSKMQAGNFQFILAGIGNLILTLVIGVLLFYFVLKKEYLSAMIFVYAVSVTLGIIYFFMALKALKHPMDL